MGGCFAGGGFFKPKGKTVDLFIKIYYNITKRKKTHEGRKS